MRVPQRAPLQIGVDSFMEDKDTSKGPRSTEASSDISSAPFSLAFSVPFSMPCSPVSSVSSVHASGILSPINISSTELSKSLLESTMSSSDLSGVPDSPSILLLCGSVR